MWNPASIGGLCDSEVDMGMELLLPTEKLSSSFAPYGLKVRRAESRELCRFPKWRSCIKTEGSPWTWGVGVFGIAGFADQLPGEPHEPRLDAAAAQRRRTGPHFLDGGVLSGRADDFLCDQRKLSVGIAPTLTIARLDINPMVFAAPDNAGGTGYYNYPTADGTRYHFGGGFQVGVYYTPTPTWNLGFCFKSPQWFETFTSNVTNELGQPESASVNFDYPLILSLGTAYSGLQNWLFACDVRYFKYAGTAGFGSPAGFAPNVAVTGLGWKSIVSLHVGAQYYASEPPALRLGYEYNPSPIGEDPAFFNVGSPLIIEHMLGIGCSYRLTEHEIVSLAYLHGFQNESTGPI